MLNNNHLAQVLYKHMETIGIFHSHVLVITLDYHQGGITQKKRTFDLLFLLLMLSERKAR